MAYFPSYEIMIDDLRDYRFYKADMIHPNEVAEQYIFEQFVNTYFSDDLQAFLPKWQQIKKALTHKPFDITSEAHQKFLKNVLKQLEAIESQVDVSAEQQQILSQIVKEVNR